MSLITYKELHEVRLDGKLVGTIKPVKGLHGATIGFAYFPKGGSKDHGEVFRTVERVKATL